MKNTVNIALIALCPLASAAERPGVTVLDHGMAPAAYPRYLGSGPGLGWQDIYNQDAQGRYWLRREVKFQGVRIPWRIGQTFAGDAARPIGRLGLRFARDSHPVTRTQPRWLATWGRHDEKFPGLLDVQIGEQGLPGAPVEISAGHTGAVGHVRFGWRHDAGEVEATFLMLPDDDRLFVEVTVRPLARVEQITVSLCCWPLSKFCMRTASLTSPALPYGKPLPLPEADATVLFADPEFDPAGKVQEAACGLTYFPDECSSATATRTFPLFVEFRLPAPQAGAPAHVHFVLWELLHRRGDEAWAYLAGREADTLACFEALPCIQAPQFANPRQLGLQEAEREVVEFDRRAKLIPAADCGSQLRDGYWAVSASAVQWQWAGFYRREAAYHLRAEDWRAASAATRQARRYQARLGQ